MLVHPSHLGQDLFVVELERGELGGLYEGDDHLTEQVKQLLGQLVVPLLLAAGRKA